VLAGRKTRFATFDLPQPPEKLTNQVQSRQAPQRPEIRTWFLSSLATLEGHGD
jgi:hypothetical protein